MWTRSGHHSPLYYPGEFRDSYYRLNENLERLKEEMDKNRSLRVRLERGEGSIRTAANTSSAVRNNSSGWKRKGGSTDRSRSNPRAHSASRSSSAVRRSYAGRSFQETHLTAADLERRRLRAELAAQEAEIRTPQRLQRSEASNDRFYDIQDDIIDMKEKLNKFVTNLHDKEVRLKTEIEKLDRVSAAYPRSQPLQEEHYQPADSLQSRGQPLRRRSQDHLKADLRDLNHRSFNHTDRTPMFPVHYEHVGGSPDYFPSATLQEQKDRFMTEGTSQPVRDARAYELSRSQVSQAGQTGHFSHAHHGSHASQGSQVPAKVFTRRIPGRSRAEVEDLLEACKIKRNILKTKLESADLKLRELYRTDRYRQELDRLEDRIAQEGHGQTHGHARGGHGSGRYPSPHDHSDRSTSELQRLYEIRESRTVENHNLNILKKRIDRLRTTGERMEKRNRELVREDLALQQKLLTYEQLVRENVLLKSKMKKIDTIVSN